MHTHRMTPSSHRFILALLSALYLAGFCYAIYDPTATTTKSPKRRESVLPWYLNENGEPLPPEEPEPPRSPKWETDPGKSPGKPIIRNSNTKSWSSWKKIPGSAIEQRAEITYDHTKRIDYGNVEDSALEFGQFEQTENQGFPYKSNDANETQKEGDYVNTGGADDKRDRDFYEDLADDGAKPHREPVVLSWKPKSTIAKYEPELGIQCPEFDSTGQFVYPLDCKFFVNCWNGRAFVQPCAPGTLFNPETLECDFPHKVNCFGEDNLGVPSKYVDASLMQFSQTHTNKESLEAALKCPSHLTGMLSHPTDCTKYLQCANGGTFIRDCGPGTVFNPAISVCDWPHNVKGCEGTFKTEEETVLTPPDPFGAQKKSEYNESHKPKIECPPDYTGMLPHPETCKKFLQCANGGTFVMDCGPGTAFNPLTSVCDWPYNVPGCSNDSIVLKTNPKSVFLHLTQFLRKSILKKMAIFQL